MTDQIYLYSLMTLAWDLDKDTHDYFRKFLDTFISLRRVSNDIRTINHQLRYIPMYRSGPPNMRYVLHNTSQITVGGGNRLILPEKKYSPYLESVYDFHIPIDEIHLPRYYMIDP